MLLVSGPPGIDLNKKNIIQLFNPCCFASKHLSQHKDRHKKKDVRSYGHRLVQHETLR